MAKQSKSVNGGVHNAVGIELQKHCVLYLLLSDYSNLKDKKYFICIEHHDDFLFCYQTPENLISTIDAYQAKKSSEKWGLSKEFYDILKKITEVGVALNNDPIPKEKNYSHSLHFITNYGIQLKIKEKKKPIISSLINENNIKQKYVDLNLTIKEKLKEEIEKLLNGDPVPLGELDNLTLAYIDLPKQSKSQKQMLTGLFGDVFKESVKDHKAAVDILINLFRDIENRFNQGNIAKLLDTSKRIDSNEINEAIKIITTKQKAYDLWRDEGKGISQKLSISVFEQTQFELCFDNSFDLFKDLTQVEHQKIHNFVFGNKKDWIAHTDHVNCITDIYNKFCEEHNTQLTELQTKATIYAAYIELKG